MKQNPSESATLTKVTVPDTGQSAAQSRRERRMARDSREQPPAEASAPIARAPTKIDQVLGLLRRGEGATLAELVATTAWLPHTTRAALTGLRKKGHVLAKDKRGEVTCYRIAEVGE